MNRWQGWARSLRTRHGRFDAWRASGAMVLLRGPGQAARALHIHVRSSLRLHAYLAVSPLGTVGMRPSMAHTPILRNVAPMGKTLREPLPAAGRATTLAARPDAHRGPVARMANMAAPPAFVPALRMGAPAHAASAGSNPLHLSVRRGEGASPIAANAVGMARRVRRNAVREEIRPAAQTAVLAIPWRAAAQTGSALDSAEASARSRARLDEARAPQAMSPVNVEALTGMVIQQIDRRLVAYRERMGRA